LGACSHQFARQMPGFQVNVKQLVYCPRPSDGETGEGLGHDLGNRQKANAAPQERAYCYLVGCIQRTTGRPASFLALVGKPQ
jgi:hypothetical protein